MVNNRQLNPLTVQLPTAKGLPDAEREDFLASIALLESQISNTPFQSHSKKAVKQAALDK